MNKFFKYAFISIFVILLFLFVKHGIIPMLSNFLNLTVNTIKSNYTVSPRKQDSIKYQSSPISQTQNRTLTDKIMLSIVSDLNKSNAFSAEYDNIDKFYVLQSYFLEYKLYLASKYKVEDIAKALPNLLADTRNLSDTELESYFKKNSNKLDKTYGITNIEKLKNLIVTASNLYKAKEVKVTIIDSSIYHNAKAKTIQVEAYLNDTLVNFIFKPYYSTTTQSAPYISISTSAGGVS